VYRSADSLASLGSAIHDYADGVPKRNGERHAHWTLWSKVYRFPACLYTPVVAYRTFSSLTFVKSWDFVRLAAVMLVGESYLVYMGDRPFLPLPRLRIFLPLHAPRIGYLSLHL
jgi:hypothetical protein